MGKMALTDMRVGEGTATPTIDQQVDELRAAGWIKVRGHVWKAPVGGYFLGPHGAWKAMKRRQRGRMDRDGWHFTEEMTLTVTTPACTPKRVDLG